MKRKNKIGELWPVTSRWTRHREFKSDPSPSLPLPRLEIRWVVITGGDGVGNNTQAQYSMVYRHLLGQVVFVPFGLTTSTVTMSRLMERETIDLPFRDGAHLANEARHIGLRAFVIAGDRVEELLVCKCGRFERWHRGQLPDCTTFSAVQS